MAVMSAIFKTDSFVKELSEEMSWAYARFGLKQE